MATPHNQAEKGQIAKTVLMPGRTVACKVYCREFSHRGTAV